MSASQRMSSADAAWLHMDRPTNLMVINSVMLFDEPLEQDRLCEVIAERLVEPYPRFRRRVVEGRAGSGPAWEEDPAFELARHMHRLALPAPGDEAALQELIGDLMATPLDRGKPLWDIYTVEGYGEGCALVTRMHHCIADGIALARVLLSLTDSAPRPARRAEPRLTPEDSGHGLLASVFAPVDAVASAGRTAVSASRTAVSTAGAAASALAHGGADLVTHPRHALERAEKRVEGLARDGEALADELARDGEALAQLMFTPPDAHTPLKGNLSAMRRVAWSAPLELQEVKAIAHAHSATVNDVVLTAVSGALRAYLRRHGGRPQQIRALVPVNLRPLDQPVPRELGNRFGLVFLALPVDLADRRRRLEEVKRRMGEIKRSRQGPVSYAVLSAGGMTPTGVETRIVDFFTSKATAVMTNVPGPSEPVYLAGTQVRSVLVWAPTSGSVGMSVSIFSYRGEVTVGLMVDAQLISDPQLIVDHLEREMGALAKLTPAAAAPSPR